MVLDTHEGSLDGKYVTLTCFFSKLKLSNRLPYSALQRCQKAVHLTWTPAAPVISCTTDGDLTPITHSNLTA